MKLTTTGSHPRTLATLTANRIAGNILREEMVHGRRHIVVPVIPMVEGVHQGISAPNTPAPRTYYSSAELAAAAATLEGIAVTVHHPMTDTALVSASSPEGQRFVTGLIRNPRFENNRLMAEAWIDVERLTSLSQETLDALTAGSPVEVSLGEYSDRTATTGTWNNEAYDESAHNIRFDHLALLPGARGACSFDDGCGVRANKRNSGKSKEIAMTAKWSSLFSMFTSKKKETDPVETRVNALIAAKAAPFKEEDRTWLTELPEKVLIMLEMSFDEIKNQLWSFVNGLDTPEYINFLEESFEGYFVYRTVRRNSMTDVPVAEALYKRSYSVDQATNQVTVADDATEVAKKIEYVPVGTTTANATHNQESAVKEQLITGLITSGRFEESDRPMLNALTECQLKRLEERFVANTAPAKPEEKPKDPPAPTAASAAPAKVPTVDEYVAAAPAEVRPVLTSMMNAHAAAKNTLIEKITANQGCPFTKEELALKDLGELQKIAALAGIKTDPIADYSAAPGGVPTANTAKVPKMPSTAPEAK